MRMAKDIDIALLRAFVAVAETGGMTSAGRLVNLTQAAVSQQIKRLEDIFETVLFDRQSRQIRLTDAGERLLAHARRLIELNDDVVNQMTVPKFEGEVGIGVPVDLISTYVPPILTGFRQAYPNIRVRIVSSTSQKLLHMLEMGQIDLTLTTEPAPAAGADMLLQQPLVWVGARGGHAYKRRPLPLSLGDETCMFRLAALPALRSHGIDWLQTCEAIDTTTSMAVVEADLAVGLRLVSTVLADFDILRGGQSGLPPMQDFFINLRLPAAGVQATTLALADHIRDVFATRFRRAA
jgi:DNA-binding transcriptional LysR family regulator